MLGTAVGVFAGDLITDPEALGLDALFPAFFLALLIGGELRGGRTAVAAALLGAAVALALSPVRPAGRAGDLRLRRGADRARRRDAR